MDEPHIGQPVITPTGLGTITAIEAGDADTDIHRYRIAHNDQCRWHYLDEIITLADANTTP